MGSSWLGPVDEIPRHHRRISAQENRARRANLRRQRFVVPRHDGEMLGREGVRQVHRFLQVFDQDEMRGSFRDLAQMLLPRQSRELPAGIPLPLAAAARPNR